MKVAIGAIDHHTLQVEAPTEVADLVRQALKHIPAERLVLSSDCGMGREGMSRRHAFYKMVSLVQGTNIVRKELGLPVAESLGADPKYSLIRCVDGKAAKDKGRNVIRAAMVGLGWWGRTIVESVQGTSDVIRFVAGATRTVSPEVQAFAEAQKLRLAENFDAVLKDPEVDAIVLATPHSQHTEQVAAARARRQARVLREAVRADQGRRATRRWPR